MKERFNVEVGLSDHTYGSTVPVVAVALGAKVVEKHFILNRDVGGPDASFSMLPEDFKKMVDEVRAAEKALGSIMYEVPEKNKLRRRSLFATKDIKAGELFSAQNIGSVRPGHGLHPRYYSELLGTKCAVDIVKGTPLSKDLLGN